MNTSRRNLAGRLVLESLVIIASILAAFALDTWWDGEKERREEQETLTALAAEFSAARENIVFYRGLQERILGSVAAVSDSLNAALGRGDRMIVLPDTLLGWAYIPPTTTVTLGTLEGLVSSGRLSIIRNRELRSALASWGFELAEVTEEEADSRELTYGDFDETVRSRMSTYGLFAAAEGLFSGELGPEELRAARPVPVDTEMLGVFHLRENLLAHALDEFDALLAALDSILELIEASRE